MNEYKRAVRDCKVGIKAFQNITASSMGFAKMQDFGGIQDPVLMPSVFYWAIIRYAKPFLNSKLENSTIRYPINNLKNIVGFSHEMHKHLLNIRNTLVAHDDFVEIPPRILISGINIKEEDFLIPISIEISNKCISFPVDISTAQEMQLHAEICRKSIYSKLLTDIEELRKITLNSPQLVKKEQKYSKNYGEVHIEKGGSLLQPPDFTNDLWLQSPVPDYSQVPNGYLYEEARVKKDFCGPEKILTPSGLSIDFSLPKIK